MVAHSFSDRFTTNVFVASDSSINGITREKLTLRKKPEVSDTPHLNIAANNLVQPSGIDLNFLLNFSRELRAPLRQITSPLEQLQRADVVLTESERKELYDTIGLHTAQILQMVDQLLDTRQKNAALSVQQAEQLDQETAIPEIQTSTPSGRRNSSYDDELLEKLFRIMEENLEETGFNVHKMCSMVHLSHMHLIRKVKQLTGQKPIDLLKSYRLKRAKELLRQNNLNIAEVAYKVGYDMPNSFSRAFKKEFGISPTAYK